MTGEKAADAVEEGISCCCCCCWDEEKREDAAVVDEGEGEEEGEKE